jgi:plasmid replication initiation protein
MASKNLPMVAEQRHNTVVKANALIQKSRFSLSTQQQKIVLFLISQIEPQDEDFNLYEFKIADFCRVCGIDPQGDNYTALKNQIKAISDKSLWIELENGEETLLRWIERPYISKRNGTIKIKIDREMKPYLLQLKERFTEYELIYTLNFKSKYSIRLYEYLKSIHYRKLKPYERTMDIEKFQKLLDSNYTEFKDFHTRVLKPAQKEINTYSDIIFDYEIIKEGRKAVAISFTVKTKDTIDRIKVSCQNNRILDKNIGD